MSKKPKLKDLDPSVLNRILEAESKVSGKLEHYDCEIIATTENQTDFVIPFDTYDIINDILDVVQNRTTLSPISNYTKVSPNIIRLTEGVSTGTALFIRIFKNIEKGSDIPINGSSVRVDSIPSDRVIGLDLALSDKATKGELDIAVSDKATKNELDVHNTKLKESLGEINTLTTTDKSNLVKAINEVNAKPVGTVDYNNLINKPSIGNIISLNTTDRSSLVNAINEVNTKPNKSLEIDSRTEKVTYFISSSGNDANNGESMGTPFRTFDRAFKNLKKINFGVREIFLLNAIDLSPTANNGIDYRECKFENYFGGELIINFNSTGTKMSPSFRNIQAKVTLQNGQSFEKAPDGYGGGTQTQFINCLEVFMENWTINRVGFSNSYSGIFISNCQWALIYLCKFQSITSRLVSIRDKSNLYVSNPTGSGNSGVHWGADFGSTIGGILNGMSATTDLGQGSQSYW